MDNTYEAFALKYASLPDAESKKSSAFFKYDVYGEPDATYPMHYYFWLVRNADRTILVDCGYDKDRGGKRNRLQETDPVELLSRMGTTPADIDHVVLTHMHYDHIGNVGLFPNATFSLARTEYEYWTGPYSDRPAISWPVESEEVRLVKQLLREERLSLIEDEEKLFPGMRLLRMPGHTPGQLIAEVDTASGRVVLASDALHFYDEMTKDRPFHTWSDLVQTFESYETLREMDALPDTTVIAGHDPAVMDLFERIDDQCVDLTKPMQPS